MERKHGLCRALALGLQRNWGCGDAGQRLGRGNGTGNGLQAVPETRAVLKLTPEGIIYGPGENENGQPIEGSGSQGRIMAGDGWATATDNCRVREHRR